MGSGGMKYMVRTADGNEYGPVDQDALVQWAESGRVTGECQVRNALMQKWNNAGRIPFLKKVIERQETERDKNDSIRSKLSGLVNPEVNPSERQGGSLTKSGKFEFAAGTTGLRFGAWVVDTALLLAIGAGLLIGITTVFGDENIAFSLFTFSYISFILLYYTFTMGTTAQTLGHWIWGLMVVRTKGEPVLMGRAYIFSVYYVLVGWSTLFFTFCLPSKRALQDILSGIRIVKITTRE